jgi:hypothetical protein
MAMKDFDDPSSAMNLLVGKGFITPPPWPKMGEGLP